MVPQSIRDRLTTVSLLHMKEHVFPALGRVIITGRISSPEEADI